MKTRTHNNGDYGRFNEKESECSLGLVKGRLYFDSELTTSTGTPVCLDSGGQAAGGRFAFDRLDEGSQECKREAASCL